MSQWQVKDEQWQAVDELFAPLIEDDPALDEAIAASDAAGLPSIQVAPNQGKLLALLARLQGARNILELGTLGGYSTIWFARAVGPGGRVVTVEVDPDRVELARATFERAGLAGVIDQRTGSGLEILPQLEEEGAGPFDLVFIDADKDSMPDYFRWAMRLTRPGSLIIADNVVRGGTLADAGSDDPAVRGCRELLEVVAEEPRVFATALQTVGSKGYDGFAIALVTGNGNGAQPG